MANLLSDEEYQYLTTLEKDLSERSENKDGTPRFGNIARTLETQLSDFLALENGKRVISAKKDELKLKREASKIRRQQERLAALQSKVQTPQSVPNSPAQKRQPNPSTTV